VGYGFYSWNSGEPYQVLISIGSGLMIFLPLGGSLALSAGEHGAIGNIRALSLVFLIIAIISNIIFNFVTLASPVAYVIVNGVLLLIYILVAYAVSRALK
jgi:hypothetical protein